MARITIEDALSRIPNRFELTLAATNRARQITSGAAPCSKPNVTPENPGCVSEP